MKKLISRCFNVEDHKPITIHSYIRMRKLKIYKNLILLSLSQCVINVIHKTMMMLNEYEHDFLGIWNYTMFNLAKIFAFIFIPEYVLSRFKLQKTIRLGMLVYSLIIFVLYVKLGESVIFSGSVMAFFASTVWVSQQFYIYRLSRIMSKVSGDDLQMILLRFSGIFFSVYRSYEIVCYLPVSFVPSIQNFTRTNNEDCGLKFYFARYNSLSEFTLPPRNEMSYVATIAIIVLSFFILLLSIFLIDPLYKLTSTYWGFEDYKPGLLKTLHLFKRRRFQLIIPMTIFAGFEKTLKSYDFLTAYVGCGESAQDSIYVYFLGSLASSQMPLALAPLVEITSLRIIFFIAAVVYLILIFVLLLETNTTLIGYYVISAMWGLASSTWDSLLYVLYGMLSPRQELEAFSQLGILCSIGTFINLLMKKFLPVAFLLWTSIVLLFLAIISIFMLPCIINHTTKKIEPMEMASTSVTSGNSAIKNEDGTARKIGMAFGGKKRDDEKYKSTEVESITTSKIYHVAIPRTRLRFQ